MRGSTHSEPRHWMQKSGQRHAVVDGRGKLTIPAVQHNATHTEYSYRCYPPLPLTQQSLKAPVRTFHALCTQCSSSTTVQTSNRHSKRLSSHIWLAYLKTECGGTQQMGIAYYLHSTTVRIGKSMAVIP